VTILNIVTSPIMTSLMPWRHRWRQ